MAAALAPIGDLYKTQLRAVARELGVPEEVVAKPPSADLWPGQTDEGELGSSYDLLDRAPVRPRRPALDGGPMRRAPASRAPWSSGSRARVARMEFKRQLPPVAKLSLRTPGFDHLYPRRRPGSRR